MSEKMKISKLSFVGIVLLLTLASFGVVSACSCTPGFWKAPQHWGYWRTSFEPTEILIINDDPVDLNGDRISDTFLQALSYPGGRGIDGAQRIFLRAWVANQLNVQANDPDEFHNCAKDATCM